MDWYIRRFEEFTPDELYDVLRLRLDVFVVEQSCPYPELDGVDKEAVHLFAREDGRTVACLRLFPKSGEPGVLCMGRVVAAIRGTGLGGELLRRGIDHAFHALGTEEIYIESQEYAQGFYAREGFVVCSDAFLEDGIPHVQMRLRRDAWQPG